MTEIAMPRLSDSMEEGTILTWLKADGEPVARDEDLVEIETDKATMTYPSPEDGVLAILASEGSSLPVGAPIASLSADGAAPPVAGNAADATFPHAPQDRVASANGAGPPADDSAPAAARSVPADAHSEPADASLASDVHATPVARRLAAIHGVELGSLRGSGPRGRVTRRDVAVAAGLRLDRGAAAAPVGPPAPATTAGSRSRQGVAAGAASEAPAGAGTQRYAASAAGAQPFAAPASDRPPSEIRELTRLQQVVVRRMAQAQATVPDFQVQTDVAMDDALQLRARLKAAAAEGDAVPSINDLIVKASARALRAHPLANGSYVEAGFELHDDINVGIAVAAEGALVVPTIVAADQRSLGSIAAESRRLSQRVRDGSVSPAELSGATFTVSNLGMYGMTAITPVVNVPQAAILGVGAIRATLARDAAGEIVDRSLLTLTLSCDHRILYGADAAAFLSDIRSLLEAPLRLLL